MSNISVSYEFIDKYVRFTKPEYIQIYLYVSYIFKKDGVFPTPAETAKALGVSEAKAEFAFEYWESRDEFIQEEGVYSLKGEEMPEKTQKAVKKSKTSRVLSSKPSYSQAEIDAVAANNKQVSALFYQCETILHKILTASDMEMLYSFHDWLGLPVEVISMLLSYAERKGKTTKRYLETVAIDWADKGIDTFEAAEEYITQLEANDSAEHAVRSILGIYDRALSTTEKKYINIWVKELNIPTELIAYAYDKMIDAINKVKLSYMDKMLQDWTEKGLKTVEEVKKADEEYFVSKPPKKQRRGTYTEEGTDYTKLEEDIFSTFLDE